MSNELTQPANRPAVLMDSRGIQLSCMDDLARFSQAICKSGLAPKGMDKPESVAIAVVMGLELGMKPMQSLQNIAVINGRPTIWGDAMLGLCRACGSFDNAAFSERMEGKGDALEAVCRCRRTPDGEVVERRFSVAQAKRAGLWGKTGPWSQYPERMLQMRARSFALRDTFPDVLRGLYTTEECRDVATEAQRPQTRVEAVLATEEPLVPEVDEPQPEPREPGCDDDTFEEVQQ